MPPACGTPAQASWRRRSWCRRSPSGAMPCCTGGCSPRSATGTLLNVSTLEAEGIAASTTGEAIGLTSLVSTVALIALFGTGLVATAGRHVSATYLRIAGIALVLVVLGIAIVFLVSAHPGIAERAARRAAGWARHVRPSIDPEKAAQTSKRLVMPARSALTGRAFLESYGFASADLLFDLLSLDLMFLAFRYQPWFGPLAVAYCGGEHRQRHPPHTRWAGRHRGDPGGHHRRLRRAAGHGGHRRARLPGRELLAPAAARGRGLPAPQAEPERGQQCAGPTTAGRMIGSWQLYVYWRQMLANGNGLVSTDIDWLLPGAQDGTARRSRKGRNTHYVQVNIHLFDPAWGSGRHLGVIAIVWPGVTIAALVILFAIYAFIGAGLQAMRAFISRTAGPVFGHLLLALIDLAAGAVALVWPGPTALVLVLVVAIWAFVAGLAEIFAAFGSGETAGTRAMYIVTGLISIAFGVVLTARPGIGAVTLALLFGLFSMIYGVSEIAAGAQMRRTGKTLHSVLQDAA